MTHYDAWLYCKPLEWDALATQEAPFSFTHSSAITGYWNPYPGGFEVYNVVGSQADIQAIIDALPTPPAQVYAWGQGEGFDSLDQWPTDPTEILAVMKDHITYDGDGNPTGSTPATLAAPNWGHVFFGQSQRVFAGLFTNDFNGDFR